MPTVYSPPVETYIALADITLASTAASVTLTGFSQDYRDLVLVVDGTQVALSASYIEFNGDATTTNYHQVYMLGTGSGSGSSLATSEPLIFNLGASQSNAIVQIMDYSATDKHKSYLSRSNAPANYFYALAGRWANNSAINTVTLKGQPQSFASGTTFKLFGIEA